MSVLRASDYVPGQSEFATDGAPAPQECKSPPLDEVAPGREGFLTVPPDRYFAGDAMERERQRLWPRAWLCAGLERDVTQPGDWLRVECGHESVIVVRGHDRELRAFHNVCRHRGMPLVAGSQGSTPRLVCRFHSWTYDLTGRCVRVTDRAQFREEALAGSLDLAAVRVDAWHGFVFVCLDADAPSLAAYLGPISSTLDAYRIDRMHVVKDVVVDMDCNWKLIVHINQEAYHFHRVHKEALPYADDFHQQIDFFPNGHNRFMTATGVPSPRLPTASRVTQEQKLLLAEVGIDPESYAGSPSDVRRDLQRAKRAPDNPFGLDYGAFSDNQLTDDWSYSIFPNMSLNVHPEGVLFMRYLPHPVDPGKSTFHVMILVPPMKPGARPPAYMGLEDEVDVSGKSRPAQQRRSMQSPGLGWALDQDCAILAELQKGMHSRGIDVLRYAEHESRIQHFWYEYGRYVDNTPRS